MKFYVDVTHRVLVTLDESKFTPQMMEEFRKTFYSFRDLDMHAEHIGRLAARGLIHTNDKDCFIEGYGLAKDMGIKAEIQSTDIESRQA